MPKLTEDEKVAASTKLDEAQKKFDGAVSLARKLVEAGMANDEDFGTVEDDSSTAAGIVSGVIEELPTPEDCEDDEDNKPLKSDGEDEEYDGE